MRNIICLWLLTGATVYAVNPNEWRFSQTLEIKVPGLVRASVPPETLDVARPDLEDIRILDSGGNEVPYLVDRTMPQRASALRPKELGIQLVGPATQITLTTGRKLPIKGVTFEAPPGGEFIKAVRVEGSSDGKSWRELAGGQPIFRTASGAQNFHVQFPEGPWDFLRLTVDDSRTPAVPFTGVLVSLAETKAPVEPVEVKINSRDETLGVTRLALELGASNLSVASVRIDASDPLFTRAITLAVPEISNDNVREQSLFNGSIYRLDLAGKTESRLEIPLDAQIRGRELIALIFNGDSAPLTINAVHIDRRPVRLVFLAREAGRYHILSGNTQANAPHYDLASMSDQLKTAAATELRPGSLTTNSAYHAPDALSDVSLAGAAIDVKDWKFRRQIESSRAGAQQLELDPEVLANSAPDQRDIRIVSQDRQLPFLIERTSITRTLSLKGKSANDPKQPALSRWSLKLPQAGIPVNRLSCMAGTSLFEREMRVWENVTDERGNEYGHELGRAIWKQLPNQPAHEFIIELGSPPRSDTLLLETRNGDNAAIELRDFRVYYPVTRLIFKTAPTSSGPLWLYYGNPDASAPRYDVSLIADQLLRAERTAANVRRQEGTGSAAALVTNTLTGGGKYIFWGVLALVVVALLFVISRLLPKASPDA